MLIKILKINEGETIVNLGEYNILQHDLVNVKFDTDNPLYEIKFVKYGRGGSQTITGINDLIYCFQLYRNGLTNLKLLSTCDGTFTFEYKKYEPYVKSDAEIVKEKIIEEAKRNHYLAYIKINDNGDIIVNESEFKKYTFYEPDSRILQCILDNFNGVNADKFSINKKYDVLYGLTINSTRKTKCTILSNSENIFEFDIDEGMNYYPLFLIMYAVIYCNLSIKFDDDCVENVTERGMILDLYTRSVFAKNKVVVNWDNGDVYKYENGFVRKI